MRSEQSVTVKRLRRGAAVAAVAAAATALVGGFLTPASSATAATPCAQRGCHQIMVKAPAAATIITIVSGTLVSGYSQGLACYPLPAHKDGAWVGTGLDMRDGTYLSIGLGFNNCDRPLGDYGSWNGTVPGRDGRNNIWITPS